MIVSVAPCDPDQVGDKQQRHPHLSAAEADEKETDGAKQDEKDKAHPAVAFASIHLESLPNIHTHHYTGNSGLGPNGINDAHARR